MVNRREFLSTLGAPAVMALGGGASASYAQAARAVATIAEMAVGLGPPEDAAKDESFWFQVQQAFTADRSLVNLNNGGVSPSPRIVQEAMKRHLDHSNTCPAYVLWQLLEPQRETVRQRLGREWGVDGEEIAVTRNASESLQICQQGFDLKPGDEVLTTTQDYPRMLTTFKQRERREGIVLKQFKVPVPCEDAKLLVSLFEQNITPKTRLILMSHMVNITGQIMPVKDVVAMARAKGIPVIVDGAHALAHYDYKLSDLDCDYYGVSLHKWLFAPHGTGLLYVRRDKIAGLWPLMAADEKQTNDIRKFEEIGTHPAANFLAIGEAITFHQGIGGKRKEARMRYLRQYWAQRFVGRERVKFQTPMNRELSCGIATIQIEGVDSAQLCEWMWKAHRIFVIAINHAEFQGIRVTPSVYTLLEELDRFGDAMEKVIRDGLPA